MLLISEHTKATPLKLEYLIPTPILVSIIVLILSSSLYGGEFDGIATYYIRLDHSFTSQTFINDHVTMVPAENEFRGDHFSLVLMDGTLHGDPRTSPHRVEALVKKEIFTKVLLSQGLKSVYSLNQNTTVSYEGVVLCPINITIAAYENSLGGFPYTANIKFSPIAFPDKWDTLRQHYNIKKILNDFFLLFK